MATANGNGPTAASAWGAADVETVELPSGNKAKLRTKLNIWALVRAGAMSQEMVAAFDQAAAGTLADLQMAVDLNDVILERMFVEPRVFVPAEDGPEEPAEGEVHVDQIDDEDIQFVLERAFRGARDAAAFRGDGNGAGGSGDGKGVGKGAQRAGRAGARKPAGAGARQGARRARS